MTALQLKALLSTPIALFVLMLAASFGSALKQIIVAKRAGTPMTLRGYFLDHMPETLIMLGTNGFAFALLVMTDSLNFASVMGIGYAANDSADAFTKTGRSSALTEGNTKNENV